MHRSFVQHWRPWRFFVHVVAVISYQFCFKFRVRNKGVPVLNGHGKGDLYVEVRVQIPSKLSKRQKELFEELEATAKVDNQPLVRSLLGKVKDMFG